MLAFHIWSLGFGLWSSFSWEVGYMFGILEFLLGVHDLSIALFPHSLFLRRVGDATYTRWHLLAFHI